MTNLKPSSHGIVVDHKESGVRYAVSDRNYNPKVHTKVRDLKPGESVLGYAPRSKDALGEQGGTSTHESAGGSESDASEALNESEGSGHTDTKAEGSAAADTKGK